MEISGVFNAKNTSQFNLSPPLQISLSRELKQVLNERNMLTVKSRQKMCRLLDNLSSENEETDKRKSLRLKAVEEILTSEKSYLKQLELLMTYFVSPLRENELIDTATHTALFGQIEMIYNLNGELLNELETDLENVANAFLRLAPFFKLYSVYAFDYKNALLVLQHLTNKNTNFKQFLAKTESRPEVQCKLNSLLIVPIQRVPRYRLLLQQVLLYTSPLERDFKILHDSIKQVENTVSHINTVIEDQEQTQVMINLQNSLLARTLTVVKPSRKLLKEGVLYKMSSSGSRLRRFCALMSDIFMYCKILKERNKETLVENSLQCSCIFPLKKCKVIEMFPGVFRITCQGDGIILCTDDVGLGQNWVAAIKEAIEVHIQFRKTLRKESSKRKPIRKKLDVKNFELENVLSPNKKKYDYENVFRCDSATSDSENENSISCFKFKTPTLLKRKRSNSTSEQITTSKLMLPVTPSPPTKMMRLKNCSPWRFKIKQPVDIENEGSSNYDPTYGFNRYSNWNSYVRTNNVDSHVPVHSPTENSMAVDVLYPLREHSGGDRSNKSSLSKSTLSRNKTRQQLTYGSLGKENGTQRKRVTFEDPIGDDIIPVRTHLNFETDKEPNPQRFAYLFPSHLAAIQQSQKSLKQRITDFFASLF